MDEEEGYIYDRWVYEDEIDIWGEEKEEEEEN